MKFCTLCYIYKKRMHFLKRGKFPKFLTIFWLSIEFNEKYCRADLHCEKRNSACDLLASGWGSDKVHSDREQNSANVLRQRRVCRDSTAPVGYTHTNNIHHSHRERCNYT